MTEQSSDTASKVERKVVTVNDVIRRHIEEHHDPYFAWIKQLATVSGSSLTALIALQSQYIPLNPRLPAVLAAALALLLLALLSALFAGRAEWSVPLARANTLDQIRRKFGEAEAARCIGQNLGVGPTQWHRRTVAAAQTFLSAAFLLLCVFAIANFEKIGNMHQQSTPASQLERPAR